MQGAKMPEHGVMEVTLKLSETPQADRVWASTVVRPARGSYLPDAFARRGASGTSRISRWHPTALAYLFRVLTEGECLPVASSRETTLFVAPIERATASWVSPRGQPRREQLAELADERVLVGERVVSVREPLALHGAGEERLAVVWYRLVGEISHFAPHSSSCARSPPSSGRRSTRCV